jgi:hypothetical protein
MKKIFFSIIIVMICFAANAQKTKKEERREKRKERVTELIKQEEEGVIVNKKHFLGGLKLTTDGYGGFLEKGIAQSVRTALLFQLEITERKHPKEEKQFNINGARYIYGKTNFFYPVKLGAQYQYLLGNKGNKNGVSISGNFGGGLTLGLLRPYLLGFDTARTGNIVYKSFDEDSSGFVFATNQTGPGFGTGFNKLKVVPGAYAKAGLRFDYGQYNEMINAIEVGLTAEFYSKKISQMAFNKNNNFFFGAYVAILFGKRK